MFRNFIFENYMLSWSFLRYIKCRGCLLIPSFFVSIEPNDERTLNDVSSDSMTFVSFLLSYLAILSKWQCSKFSSHGLMERCWECINLPIPESDIGKWFSCIYKSKNVPIFSSVEPSNAEWYLQQDKKTFQIVTGSDRDNITVLAACSASGKALPPMTINKAQHVQSTWQPNNPDTSSTIHDNLLIRRDG